jgi:DNA-binding response OmpR family regulator
MDKIFIIEDDHKLREELSKLLHAYGFQSSFSDDFENMIDVALNEEAQLILLDVNLPFYDGYHVCREIRKRSSVPIMIVTSRNTDMDEIMSLNLGADDFITKPYHTGVLIARILSVLNRGKINQKNQTLSYKELTLDLAKSLAIYKGNVTELTKNEQQILHLLMKKKETIVSRDEMMNCLWQSDEFVEDNTLTMNINRLRKKLDSIGAGDFVKTKRGLGYIV